MLLHSCAFIYTSYVNFSRIDRILLTNDLTERVMQEAVDKKANMIISYHPPIFAPLKRITQKYAVESQNFIQCNANQCCFIFILYLRDWKQRIVSICLGNSIALYSPHTAWDVTLGGVNDWLASSIKGSGIQPIQVRGAKQSIFYLDSIDI